MHRADRLDARLRALDRRQAESQHVRPSFARGFVSRFVITMGLCAGVSSCAELPGLGAAAIGFTDGNNAQLIPVDISSGITFVDQIFPFGDFDGYDLGAFNAGDRIRVAFAGGFLLRASAMLVDGDREVILDGLDGNSPDLTEIEHVLANEVTSLRLYVGPGHQRRIPVEILPVPTDGFYAVTVEKTGVNIRVPSPRPQVVILDFSGGFDEQFFGRPTYMAPFVAAQYNPALAGRESEIAASALARVREIYAAYAIDVRLDIGTEFNGPVSRVYVTAPDYFTVLDASFAAGQVRYIDFGNRDRSDVAIVSTAPTATTDPARLGVRLGRLAAHEIGHLLGLVHQTEGLMGPSGGSNDLEDAPVHGFFGYTNEAIAAFFPDAPRLLQTPEAYLIRVIGSSD